MIITRIFSLAAVLLFVAACNSGKPHSFEYYIFGTLVTIDIYGEPPEKSRLAAADLSNEFERIHKEWHAWEKTGVVSQINSAFAAGGKLKISPEVARFIKLCQQYSRQSRYYFNPAIGGLIALWGFHAEKWQGPPPSREKIEVFIKPPLNLEGIVIVDGRIFSSDKRVQLDFGAIAKGYAIELAYKKLKKLGIKTALINAGGDIKTLGVKSKGPWKIGITGKNGQTVGKVEIFADESVVTSGTYRRKFTWQDREYHHVLNPKTGYPSQGLWLVTVVHPDAVLADAAATALLAAGKDKWDEVIAAMGIRHALAIDNSGKVLKTAGMEKRVSLYLSPAQ